MGKKIALLGDPSSHGGTLITTGQDGKVIANNISICVSGCTHSCSVPGHGITLVVPITVKSFINNLLIITEGAVAGCGAIITPPDRKIYIE